MSGGKNRGPEPPDPRETASAQVGQNVGSAVANQILGNVNQVTPYGSLNFDQTGSTSWTDPISGKLYNLPQYTATTTLSDDQKKLNSIQTQGETNLATLARDQSARLGTILGKPVDLSGAPDVSAPNPQTGVGKGGTILGSKGLQDGLAGNITGTIADAGHIRSGRGLQSGMAGDISNQFGDAGDITRTYGTDFSSDRQRVEDALMARLNPQLDQERSRLATQLSNQGIKLGSEAYDRAMQNFNQQTNDARFGAVLNAGQEQSRLANLEAQRAGFENAAQQQAYGQLFGRAQFANDAAGQQFGQNLTQQQAVNDAQAQLFGQNLQESQLQNQAAGQQFGQNLATQQTHNAATDQRFNRNLAMAGLFNQTGQQDFQNQAALRDAYLQEAYAARNQPINEIAALLGTGQVQNPQFVNTGAPQMPTVDYAGLVNQNYNQRAANWQQQQAGRNSMLGGLFGLGAAGIMASDERLKENVEPVGHVEVPVYKYNYKSDKDTDHIGVMAQDVAKVKPEAVVPMGKYLGVDYRRLAA